MIEKLNNLKTDITVSGENMRNIRFPTYYIRQYERGIVERFGKFIKFVEPGLHFQMPFADLTRVRDVREHTLNISPQPVITKDNVEIRVDGIMWARPKSTIEDIKRSFYEIDEWKNACIELTKTNIRNEFGELTLDESLIARMRISANLRKVLDRLTDDWGLEVSKVEIQAIDPPLDIKHAMHKQKTAEQERRAMKLHAMGKFEAAEQEKKAVIQKAEGRREAKIRVAQGEAEAIKLVNEAAEKYFIGNAQKLKEYEVTENALSRNSKIVITEKGIKPHIILGNIPIESSG
jgi:regulator of protease activity HflC (stomatin/prohibitin superfamily)